MTAPTPPRQARPNRKQKAAATRRRIRDAAKELFISEGYAASSMERIAQLAGVAVQTMYYTFGTKLKLLTEIIDIAVAGDDEPTPTLDRDWVADAVAAPPARQIEIQVDAARRISERVAPVLHALRGAATADSDAGLLWQTNRDQFRTVQRHLIGALADKDALRDDLTVEIATDIAVTLLGIDTYLTLVLGRDWTPYAWQQWVTELLKHQLLSDIPR